MKRHRRLAAVGVLIALCLANLTAIGYAQREDSALPEAFARAFVTAVNSSQLQARHTLLHAKVAACVTRDTRPYFDSIFARQARSPIPANYRARASKIAGPAPLLDGRSPYPVQPTHQLQIDYGSELRSTTLFLLVAHDGERWRQVLGCPSAETVVLAARADAARARDERRAGALADAIREPLRGELLALLSAGRRVEATQKYAAASGEDLAMARRVIDLLAPR